MKPYELKSISMALCSSFSNLSSQSDVFDFMVDLLSENEILELSKRLKTAEMLIDNISYSNIEKETWMSSTTIAKISKTIKSWKGGYEKALNKKT